VNSDQFELWQLQQKKLRIVRDLNEVLERIKEVQVKITQYVPAILRPIR
jgi:hypothetical protein